MKHLKAIAVLLSLTVFSLTGCGSSGNTTNDPLSTKTSTGGTDPQVGGTIFGNVSTAQGKTGIAVSTDVKAIDANNGQVLVTARIFSNGAALAGVPITFAIVAPSNGPATFESGLNPVKTDANGEAITRLKTGDFPSTTNVIVSATAPIGNKTATANTTFQIVRGSGGVIMFTSAAGLNPGGQTDMGERVSLEVEPGYWDYLQLIPFKLADSNGNPRVGFPVTVSVYSITTKNPKDVTVDFLVPPVTEADQETITTDSAGQGIFNAAVHMGYIADKETKTVNLVLKATTNDAPPVTAYLGLSYTFIGKAPPPDDKTQAEVK